MTSPFLTTEEKAIFEELNSATMEASLNATANIKTMTHIEKARVLLVDYIVEQRAKASGV